MMTPSPSCAPLSMEPLGYDEFYMKLCTRLKESQHRALRAANTELLLCYWYTGQDLIEREGRRGWGTKVAERISADIRRDSASKGWSVNDVVHMRQFAEAWPDPDAILHGSIGLISWGHIMILLDRLNSQKDRDRFALKVAQNDWSKTTLHHAIDVEPVGKLTDRIVERRDGTYEIEPTRTRAPLYPSITNS